MIQLKTRISAHGRPRTSSIQLGLFELWKDADPDIPNPEASQSGVHETAVSGCKLMKLRFCYKALGFLLKL